jgi:hypothetical protein
VTRALSFAELEQRRNAPLKSGAHSPGQIKAKARAHRRRFLRQIGLRAGDMDAVALAYLDGWATARAKVDMYDTYDGLHGSREYIACHNSARLSMVRLEARLKETGLDRGRGQESLADYLDRRYGDKGTS